MKKPIGFGFAIATFASLAIAGGEGDQEKPKSGEATKAMEKMASTPSGGGASVDAAAGKGFTVSVGDEFSVNVKNRVQVLWRYSDFEGAQDTNNFSIRRARTALGGHVWDMDKTYFVQLDWARDGSSDILLDAWFNWDFWKSEDAMNEIGIRFGQQKPHHGREFQGTSAALDHTERSLASNVFSGTRVIGAWLHGDHLEDSKLHWWAGVGNSDPAAASGALEGGSNGPANVDNEVNFFFDARFDPWGDYGDESFYQGDLEGTEEIKGTVGASLMFGNHRVAAAAPDVETTSINIYTGFKYSGVHVLGEAFIRSDDPDAAGASESDATGFAVDLSYTLPQAEPNASQWGFAARWSLVDFDDAPVLLGAPIVATSGDANELSATITNYYKANALKSQLGYRYLQLDPDAGSSMDNHFLDVLFQFVF